MRGLLRLSKAIDSVNSVLGWVAAFLVLAAVLVSAGNAGSRYVFNATSNAFLEFQWYAFGYIVFLGAAYTLKTNGHVRVDIFYSNLSHRGQLWVDIFGLIVFLLPAMGFLAWLSWPLFTSVFLSGERSANFGGLIRWPIMLVLPLGFALVTLQGISELIKRIGALHGDQDIDTHYEQPLQ